MVLTCTERHFLTGRNFLDSGNENVWNHPYMSLSLSVATHDVGGKKGNKNEYPLESRCRYLITVLVILYYLCFDWSLRVGGIHNYFIKNGQNYNDVFIYINKN